MSNIKMTGKEVDDILKTLNYCRKEGLTYPERSEEWKVHNRQFQECMSRLAGAKVSIHLDQKTDTYILGAD